MSEVRGQDALQYRRVQVDCLQTLLQPPHCGAAPSGAPPADEASERGGLRAEGVVGTAAENIFSRQAELEQQLLPVGSQQRRQPGELAV